MATLAGVRLDLATDPRRPIGTEAGQGDGVSPRNLQASTLGDELRYATNNASRVFAVAGKDRGAILPAGKTGTA